MMADGSPETAHKWAFAERGQPRHGVDEGMPVDQFKGVGEKPTPVGQSLIQLRAAQGEDERASAARHGRDSPNNGPNTREYNAALADFNEAKDRVKAAEGEVRTFRLQEPPKDAGLNSKDYANIVNAWKVDQAGKVKEAQARLDDERRGLETARTKKDEAARVGGPREGENGGKKPSVAEAHAQARSVLDKVKANGGNVKAASEAVNKKLRELGLPPLAY